MDPIDTLPIASHVLTVAGTTVEITPLRVGELPQFLAAVQPIAEVFSEDPDWLSLLAVHGRALLKAIALAARSDLVWVESLQLDDAVRLAEAVFEVNADFFVRRVAPALQQAARKVRSVTTSLGTTPLPS
jgi:hypothetical protein